VANAKSFFTRKTLNTFFAAQDAGQEIADEKKPARWLAKVSVVTLIAW